MHEKPIYKSILTLSGQKVSDFMCCNASICGRGNIAAKQEEVTS